jgi:UDP-glucose 4-epimerase
MRILVTGADGFIGQHLVRALLDAGHRVRGMYNVEKQLYFFAKAEIEWRKADLRDAATIAKMAEDIDVVYHLAAIPRNDKRKTWDDFQIENVNGTSLLLEESNRARVRRFIYVSSVEAAGYGDGSHPRVETDAPRPDNNYGKSKLKAEELVLGKKWNMECVVMRLPMVYGPGTFLIVPKLFGFVKKGFYPLIGNGQSLMEFCYVGNAVNALVLACHHKKIGGELFYVSDERSYSIKEVISHIAAAMKVNVLFIHVPVFFATCAALCFEAAAKLLPFPPLVSRYSRKPFFTRETVWWTTRNVNIVSTEKIRRILGYQPLVSIEDGCRKTVEWLHLEGVI